MCSVGNISRDIKNKQIYLKRKFKIKNMRITSKKGIIIIIISVVVTLLLLEIGFRICGTSYHKFNHISQEYYINPREYYDFLYFDEDNDPVYGLHYNKE